MTVITLLQRPSCFFFSLIPCILDKAFDKGGVEFLDNTSEKNYKNSLKTFGTLYCDNGNISNYYG